jgi:putative flavoprotein involved in K+ transport
VFWWAERMGALDAPYPAGRAANTHPPSPAISGVAGGKELDPRKLARAGVVLLGRVTGADATGLELSADLRELLAAADASAARWRSTIDDYIATSGISAPEPPPAEAIRPLASESEPLRRLDLAESRVACVIWATGFRTSFDWVHAPVFADGVVQQTRGVTDSPGLFFLRVFPHKRRSQLLYGLDEDVAHIAERIRLR